MPNCYSTYANVTTVTVLQNLQPTLPTPHITALLQCMQHTLQTFKCVIFVVSIVMHYNYMFMFVAINNIYYIYLHQT